MKTIKVKHQSKTSKGIVKRIPVLMYESYGARLVRAYIVRFL